MRNPWMSLWLSAANSWAGAVCGLWAGELQRQRTALANELIRQSTDFWTRIGKTLVAAHKPKRRG